MTTAEMAADSVRAPAESDVLLSVEGLTVARRDNPEALIVDNVSFAIHRGEMLGLAGESGCGKTTTALALMGLLPSGLVRAGGEINLYSRSGRQRMDLLSPRQLRAVRWASVSMIFQSAMNSLDPVKRVGAQIAEAIRLHEKELNRDQVTRRVHELLDQVGVPSKRARDYPHEFSGGQRQRVMIALALACRPELVIGDEPTTALDVITQAQILGLLEELRDELGLSLLLITHDLAVLGDTCDRVAVMYSGEIVETGPSAELFATPQHPYTQRLLTLFGHDIEAGALPEPIPGSAPAPEERASGCVFQPRCHRATDECAEDRPVLIGVGPGHDAACRYAPWSDHD